MIDKIISFINEKPLIFIADIVVSIAIGMIITFLVFKKKSFFFKLLLALFFGPLCVLIGFCDFEGVPYAFIIGILVFTILTVFGYINNIDESKPKRNRTRENDSNSENNISKEELINSLVETIEFFSKRHTGAIITFEKNDNLNAYKNKAIKIDADFSKELLKTIFFPNTALHDGAVIMKGSKIVCASAYYPLSDNPDLPSDFGTRHRAAIGISEDTDAFSILVSEETGSISYTIDGTITTHISSETLRTVLNEQINY